MAVSDPSTTVTPRRRRIARWVVSAAVVTNALFIAYAMLVEHYVLPKRPPPIAGRWQYPLEYDGVVGIAAVAMAFVAGALWFAWADLLRSRLKWAASVLLLFQVAVGLSLIPIRSRSRELDNRKKCMANLRRIGACIDAYAARNNRQLPPDFASLLAMSDVDASDFVCPSGNDEVAAGTTPEEVRKAFLEKGHCSYVYRGGGWTRPSAAKTIIARDYCTNHYDGLHVLYADGTVEWLPTQTALEKMPELARDYERSASRSAATTQGTTH